eukprot:m.46097 g.46097  ORF g.46097 m.46097 type:complete len:204 (+) comp20148_c0_seq1:212-823(+)
MFKRAGPPPGKILAKTTNPSEIISSLAKVAATVIQRDDLDVDFVVARDVCVLLFTEEEILSADDNLVRSRAMKAKRYQKSITLVWKSELCSHGFLHVQYLVSTSFRMPVWPVSSYSEAARLIKLMLDQEQNSRSGSIKHLSTTVHADDVVKTIKLIPGFGDKKITQLLTRFSTWFEIANASQDDLVACVGDKGMRAIKKFLEG